MMQLKTKKVEMKSPYQTIAELERIIKLLVLNLDYSDRLLDNRQNVMANITMDACSMASADVLQMGPGRAKKWRDKVMDYIAEFNKMANEEAGEIHRSVHGAHYEGDEFITATRDQIDRRIEYIFGKSFIPYDLRYSTEESKQLEDKYKPFIEACRAEHKRINEICARVKL